MAVSNSVSAVAYYLTHESTHMKGRLYDDSRKLRVKGGLPE